MVTVIPAEGLLLDRIRAAAHAAAPEALTLPAYAKFDTALIKTAWGLEHQRRFALMEGERLLASATRYDLAGVVDGRAISVCGLGAVLTLDPHGGGSQSEELVERLLRHASRDGAELALAFSNGNVGEEAHFDRFDTIPLTDVELTVAELPRGGAPMTLVRGGEARDLAAIVAMGRARAESFSFHLDRDVDFVQYAITRKRLLAGLGRAQARQLQFFIAEEGITAAAYVVLSQVDGIWTLEECGDRDPTGARVGAILQALVAREPAERRPTIRGWLPAAFVPPQITLVPKPSSRLMRVRWLRPTPVVLPAGSVLYWRCDLF
jgi:hypothetical protein